jgi:rhodanese-related sulfurtransferase
MRFINFVRILLFTLAVSGYSAWVLNERVPKAKPEATEFLEATDIPLWRCADVETFWHDPSTLFVDVRTSIDYKFGHIRGAISLPYEEFAERFPSLKPRLERAQTIIVYCQNKDCGKSWWTAIRLRKAGLTQIGIYPDGWNEWFLHELPTEGTGR